MYIPLRNNDSLLLIGFFNEKKNEKVYFDLCDITPFIKCEVYYNFLEIIFNLDNFCSIIKTRSNGNINLYHCM